MVANSPTTMRYSKRVGGLPGASVRRVKGRLFLSRAATTEPVAGAAAATKTSPLRTSPEHLPAAASNRIKPADGGNGPCPSTPAFALPAGNLCVPSDHRANSIDSRPQRANFGGLRAHRT
jgi:hypothetical protein